MGKRYVLYGAGWEAERLLAREHRLMHDVAYCIDANRAGDFHGIPIYRLENASNLESYFIIVSVVWDTFLKLRDLLEERGLKEFRDFIWGTTYNKKLVVINTNCYGHAIIKYLRYSDDFSRKYCIYPTPMIQFNTKKELGDALIGACDVYIHQDIQSSNQYGFKLSDEYVLPKLKKDCRSITIPNLVGMGGWQYPEDLELSGKNYHDQIFYTLVKNKVIEEGLKEGCSSSDDFLSFFSTYSFSESDIEAYRDQDTKKLISREKNWDVKISDFIFEKYKSIPCFVDKHHPSVYVVYEMGNRLAALLDICPVEESLGFTLHIGYPHPMVPFIKKYFHIEYICPPENSRCNLDEYDAEFTSFEEWLACYLWWFHGRDLYVSQTPETYKNCRIIIYGVNAEAERLIYRNKWLREKVEYAVDECVEGTFHDIPIRRQLENCKNEKNTCVIVSADKTSYPVEKECLEKAGWKEFRDFIWSRAFEKKIIVMQTDYLGEALAKYLNRYDDFERNYCVHLFTGGGQQPDSMLLKHCDIYISQHPSGRTDGVQCDVPDLRDDCKRLTVPDLKGKGRWLFPTDMDLAVQENVGGTIGVQYRNEAMESAVKEGFTELCQYEEYYSSYAYDEAYLRQKFENAMADMRKNEEYCDLKIVDYIVNNYKSTPMFIDSDHPSVYLVEEMGKQVVAWLGLAGNINARADGFLRELRIGFPQPMLPSVANFWGIDYRMPSEKMRDALGETEYDSFEEYARSYLWWFHGRSFEM